MTAGGDLERQAPLQALAVAPQPLRDPGGGRRSALVALLAVATVVGLGIGLAQQGAATPASATPATPAASPSATTGPVVPATPGVPPSATPAGSDTALLEALLEGVSPTPARALATQVQAGALDGRLVLVNGRLEAIPFPCAGGVPEPGHECVLLAVEGVDAAVSAGSVALPWHEPGRRRGWLAFAAWNGRLVYLGSVGERGATLHLDEGRVILPADCASTPDDAYCQEAGAFLIYDVPADASLDPTVSGIRVRVAPELRRVLPPEGWAQGLLLVADPLPPCTRMPAAIPPDDAIVLAVSTEPTPSPTPEVCDRDQRQTTVAVLDPATVVVTRVAPAP